MAVTRGSAATPEADELQESIGTVPLIQVAVTPTVDSFVAAGIFATSCLDRDQPFQLSVTRSADRSTGLLGSDPSADSVLVDWQPGSAATRAIDLAQELDVVVPDWLRALGCFDPFAPESDERDGDAGFGLPDNTAVSDLAHTTLLHGPVSGDPSNVEERYDTDGDHRSLASAVTLEALEATSGAATAAASLETFLSPQHTPDGPFDTVAGTYDVLDVVASVDPGAPLSCCCGQSNQPSLLSTWRETTKTIHGVLDGLPATPDNDILEIDADNVPTAPLARVSHLCVSPSTIVCRGQDEQTVVTHREEHRQQVLALDATLIDHGDGRITIESAGDIDLRALLEGEP